MRLKNTIVLLYSSNEQFEFKIKNTIAIYVRTKDMKDLGINLTNMCKIGMEKTLVKEMKEYLRK